MHEPTVWQALGLGTLQGLTEFLPVSSSAHLILARAFFGWDAEELGMAFDVACHVGTLLAVLVYFRRDLWAMAGALPRAWSASITSCEAWRTSTSGATVNAAAVWFIGAF